MALYRGTLESFDSGTYLATVRLDGGPGGVWSDVRCSRLASGEFVTGRRVVVDTGDGGQPGDAVVVAVF